MLYTNIIKTVASNVLTSSNKLELGMAKLEMVLNELEMDTLNRDKVALELATLDSTIKLVETSEAIVSDLEDARLVAVEAASSLEEANEEVDANLLALAEMDAEMDALLASLRR